MRCLGRVGGSSEQIFCGTCEEKIIEKMLEKNHLACNSISILAASVSKRKILADVNIRVAKTVAVIHLSGVREGCWVVFPTSPTP